eukprot:Ihof_evm6s12 gene=Ihof_evmTU6s12
MEILPEVMRAAAQHAFGVDDESIKVEEVPLPKFDKTSDEVLVKVHAASINPIDYKIAKGYMKLIMPRTFPSVIGFDLSGTVVKVGDKCQRIKVGDEVYANIAERGSMAEFAAAPETHFSLKPKNVSFSAAATIPLAGETAYQAIHKHLEVKPNEKILILGGSGGVGSLAIQIAKAAGANVCTTSSNVELVTGLGADRVINYREEKWEDTLKPGEFDCVFDCVGEAWEGAQIVLKKNGRFATVVGDKNDEPFTVGMLLSTGASFVGRSISNMFGRSPAYKMIMADATDYKTLEALAELIEQEKVKPVLDPTEPYSLDTTLAMFEKLMSHRVK